MTNIRCNDIKTKSSIEKCDIKILSLVLEYETRVGRWAENGSMYYDSGNWFNMVSIANEENESHKKRSREKKVPLI